MGLAHTRETAAFWINHLRLMPHPEGGYYRQTYSSEASLSRSCLPPGFTGSRAASTAIYFLLEGGDFSAFHRIRSDELWHFYIGDPLEILILGEHAALEIVRLGPGLNSGESFQAVVLAGRWFASRVAAGGSFAVVGCTVSPGFHFDDFELARREKLISLYPRHASLIQELTRT
jgi:hypothetical protein